MPDLITVTGVVATPPTHTVTPEKLDITHFRLASTHRKYDRTEQKWVDAGTNWYSITAFRQLAANIVGSIDKGQRVVVTGRLSVNDWVNGDKSGTQVEIIAEAVGHDLSWGSTVFTRSVASSDAAAGDPGTGDVETGEAESTDDAADAEVPDDAGELLAFPEARAVPVPF